MSGELGLLVDKMEIANLLIDIRMKWDEMSQEVTHASLTREINERRYSLAFYVLFSTLTFSLALNYHSPQAVMILFLCFFLSYLISFLALCLPKIFKWPSAGRLNRKQVKRDFYESLCELNKYKKDMLHASYVWGWLGLGGVAWSFGSLYF